MPNLRNLDPRLMERVATVDPGNRYGAIYLWGTVGLGHPAGQGAALWPEAPLDGLDLLLKPENAARLAKCGLAVMDSATDVLPSVLTWLGSDPDTTDPAELKAAEQALLAVRPHLRAIPGSGALLDMLATGEVCVALTYSGDVIQAAARAREAVEGRRARLCRAEERARISGSTCWPSRPMRRTRRRRRPSSTSCCSRR